MTHGQAVATMVAATLMWSIAGVVTRHLQVADGFEMTFWRSAFNAIALTGLLLAWRGAAAVSRALRTGGARLWLSGLCWAVMYTAFMVALGLTTVANVLVTMAIAPLLTALAARLALGHRLPPRTWIAIAVAGGGIAWMYGHELLRADTRHLLGIVVALAVPAAAAVNWTLLQHAATATPEGGAEGVGATAADVFLTAVAVGAVLSAAVTLIAATPFQATAVDLGLLALLGVVQLAIPCLLAVIAARTLGAPEVSLLALLEVVFGVAWAWLGAGEAPAPAVLAGGAVVMGTLAVHAAVGVRSAPAAPASEVA